MCSLQIDRKKKKKKGHRQLVPLSDGMLGHIRVYLSVKYKFTPKPSGASEAPLVSFVK